MIIVNVDKLRDGMQLADNVCTTTATEYKVLFKKGVFLSSRMIQMIRDNGIKSVRIVNGGIVDIEMSDSEKTEIPFEEVQRNERISRALTDLDDIFDCSEEIKELSQSAVKKVDNIADDII